MNKLQVTWCYPDILNLHGDRGNLMALERVAGFLGVEIHITRVEHFRDPIDFEHTDILFFNPGEFRTNRDLIRALHEQKEALLRYVEEDGIVFIVGTSGGAFARRLVPLEGEPVEGLGILDLEIRERDSLIGDDLVFRVRDGGIGSGMELNGSQIHIMEAELGTSDAALGDVLYGYGNQGYEAGLEGARYRNVLYTNLLGPVLVKNPWLAEALLRTAMTRRGMDPAPELPEEAFALERKSAECIRNYCIRDFARNKSGNPWNPTEKRVTGE